ncbi:MAG TPA: Ig-like domain-containing protein [Candidatus Binataceae bacterium]|nr:Ig-like domain-containing protein [Candidatus Binataceae bacterium]
MILTAPAPPGLASATFSGKVPSGLLSFSVLVTDHGNTAINCTGNYQFNFRSTSGGWGDVHVNTVEAVHYNFQSAGEFTVLRGDGFEIQGRQIPVATTSVPGADPYTGLATCVAIYSAVAASVGRHRVTYEPEVTLESNVGGVSHASRMQLRVDGVPTELGPEGRTVGPDLPPITTTHDSLHNPVQSISARIIKSPAGDGIEIHYSDGTLLVVTPAWWPGQQQWYLNVNVYGTTATKGIFGKLADKSWLPALPDGTSLGPKPTSLDERYVELYDRFANAWRVKGSASLFDYAPGTTTATFTIPEWPRKNPESCTISNSGQPPAHPGDVRVAEKLCSPITDKDMRADCVFDVSVTGHPGFAQTYLLTQNLRPDLTETKVRSDDDESKQGKPVTFVATVAQKLPRGFSIPGGSVQFVLDGKDVGKPLSLDAKGKALWRTSSLPVGRHEIVAKYIPTGWGGPFLPSTSPARKHRVENRGDD